LRPDIVEAFGKLLRRSPEGRPAITKLRHAIEHCLRIAAKPDRQLGRLQRLRRETDVLEADELAFKLRLVLSPPCADSGQIPVRTSPSFFERTNHPHQTFP